MKPKLTRQSTLKFTPYAWSKLLYMRDHGDTEIGGYGITPTEDPLLVSDFVLVKQKCTGVSVELDEQDSERYNEEMLNTGLDPWQFSNIWIHTHPGSCAKPSAADEKNFNKNFSHPNWAIFVIIARDGAEYCRIRNNIGPGIEAYLDIEIDYSIECPAISFDPWETEYKQTVQETHLFVHDRLPLCYQEENHDEFFQNLGQFINEENNDDISELDTYYDHSDKCVYYWHNPTEQYVKYDPKTDRFYDEDDNSYGQKPEPDWFNHVRQWAEENVLQVDEEENTIIS